MEAENSINDTNNEDLDSSTDYQKHTQLPTINLKKKETDATENFIEGTFEYFTDLRKRRSGTEQQKNTEKLSDEAFV